MSEEMTDAQLVRRAVLLAAVRAVVLRGMRAAVRTRVKIESEGVLHAAKLSTDNLIHYNRALPQRQKGDSWYDN